MALYKVDCACAAQHTCAIRLFDIMAMVAFTYKASGPNFIKLLSRKYCLANFFAKARNEWGTSCNIVKFLEFWTVTSFCFKKYFSVLSKIVYFQAL